MAMSLKNIENFIQSYINTIAIVLKLDITVVDNNLVRIAGTNRYSTEIGNTIHKTKFYQDVFSSGLPNIMCKKTRFSACYSCARYRSCSELADIAYPIKYNNDIIGVISLIAFTEESKETLINNDKSYIDFLKCISTLLASQLLVSIVKIPLKSNLSQIQNKSKVEFISADSRVKKLLETAKQTANSDSTTLITGESGTGKDVLAKIIHQSSNRSAHPLISVNCGAIPENLIESELFGYERGAFTGANREGSIGKFELANNGILFLDEVGEMPLTAQTRLLRVLQEKTIQRIGGKDDIAINVKIICATNQNLQHLIQEKKFREDLYYRIHVIPLHIPPLRERKNDIQLLSEHFLNQFNHKFSKEIIINNNVLDILKTYLWPGNVRELKNFFEYLTNIKMSGEIDESDIPPSMRHIPEMKTESSRSLKSMLKIQESQLLHSLISTTYSANEKKQLANQLGISVSSLYRKIAEYKLQKRG